MCEIKVKGQPSIKKKKKKATLGSSENLITLKSCEKIY